MSQKFQLPLNTPQAMGTAVYQISAKLGLYRECLRLARGIKDDRVRAAGVDEVRNGWRENRGIVGPTLRLTLAGCLDRVAYARMCLSKTTLRKIPAASENYDWAVANPLEFQRISTDVKKRHESDTPRPEFPQGEGKRDFVPKTNWGRGNVDPDMVKRHKELTDRQFFMGPHWRGKPKPLIYEDLSFEDQIAAHFTKPPEMPHSIKKNY